MTWFATRFGTVLIGTIAAAILIVATFAPQGMKIIDEVIYYAAAEAMQSRGSLIIENGWDQFGADALKLRFMVAGPNGLTSPYPIGSAVLGAPFMALFGIQGLILMNAVAAVITLFLTRALARVAFGREDVALAAVLLLVAGTYWTEYAFGIWPHAPSALFVTASLYALMRGVDAGTAAFRWAVLSGLAVGTGMLFRVDTAMILPAIIAATILIAQQPWRVLIGGIVGLLPPLAMASAANFYKFGTWIPVSYGSDEGGIALTSHVPTIALMMLGLFLLIVVRRIDWHPPRWQAGLAGAAIVAILILIIPSLGAKLGSWLHGSEGLIVDARTLWGPKIVDQSGVRYFWNMPKKALGQSLPWLGLAAMVLVMPLGRRDARGLGLLLAAAILWTVPFAMTAWYGGYGMNMRYFVAVLPALAIVGARLWFILSDTSGAGYSVFFVGVGYTMIGLALWSRLHPSGVDGVQQALATNILTATAIIALVGGWLLHRSRTAVIATQFIAVVGFAMSAVLLQRDLSFDRWGRNLIAEAADQMAWVPENSLIYGRPALFPFQLPRKPALAAMQYWEDDRDLALIEAALKAGFEVYVPWYDVKKVVANPNIREVRGELGASSFPFSEVALVNPASPANVPHDQVDTLGRPEEVPPADRRPSTGPPEPTQD